jgi:hypothetical protein
MLVLTTSSLYTTCVLESKGYTTKASCGDKLNIGEPVAIVSEQYVFTPFNVIYATHFTHHCNKQADVCTLSMLSL